jgi:hypothetical protein
MRNDLQRYYDLRHTIKTGSAILWKGKGAISWMIRRWSNFSHASLIIRPERYVDVFKDRVFLIEALSTGLVPRLLSERLADYDGEAWLFTPNVIEGEDHANCVLRQAITQCALGIRYDYASLFKNMIGRVSRDADRFFCSEFVDYVWSVCDIKRKKDKLFKKAPRPGDIPKWYEGKLVKLL